MSLSWVAAVTVVLVGASARADPPAPLRCLERWYAAKAVERGGAWWLELSDGRSFPYDDGRAKSGEERLAQPALKDLFSVRYRSGPIVPVTTPDDDPGRARLDALFEVTYPRSGLTRMKFLGRRILVHERVRPAFARVAGRLQKAVRARPSLSRFLRPLGGTFSARKIAGTDRTSAHAWGIAIDLNVRLSHYWRWQRSPALPIWRNRIPQAIVDAFEAEGFIWGGRWYHYDTMHFEYRPELLDAACYPGSG
jgi:hypothetical protein